MLLFISKLGNTLDTVVPTYLPTLQPNQHFHTSALHAASNLQNNKLYSVPVMLPHCLSRNASLDMIDHNALHKTATNLTGAARARTETTQTNHTVSSLHVTKTKVMGSDG